MKLTVLFQAIFLVVSVSGQSPETGRTNVYLFPGQGSDYRIFQRISLPENYDTIHISYPVPERKATMKTFAQLLSLRIDTSHAFILIGVSLGGMLCCEIAEILKPEKVIIISSAAERSELPFRYRFQKYVPLNRIIPKRLLKAGALMMQPLVEPDRNREKATFKSMLRAKDPRYLKRTINMIINWDRNGRNPAVVHIHGDRDHTIPIRNVKCDIPVKDGSHMMTLTRGDEINMIIVKHIKQ